MSMKSVPLHSLRAVDDPGTRSTEPNLNASKPNRLSISPGEVAKLRQSNSSRINHFAWLIDSGATCHILSVNATECYEIVKRHEGPPPRLMDASDNEMSTISLVDVKVKFGKLGPVVLQNVIICDIGFNVLSPWQASLRGWGCWLSGGNDSCLTKETAKGSLWVPLTKEARSWWLLAQSGSRRKKSAEPQAMEVDRAKDLAEIPKGMTTSTATKDSTAPCGDGKKKNKKKKGFREDCPSHAAHSLEVTPFKFLLRRLVLDFAAETCEEERCFEPLDVLDMHGRQFSRHDVLHDGSDMCKQGIDMLGKDCVITCARKDSRSDCTRKESRSDCTRKESRSDCARKESRSDCTRKESRSDCTRKESRSDCTRKESGFRKLLCVCRDRVIKLWSAFVRVSTILCVGASEWSQKASQALSEVTSGFWKYGFAATVLFLQCLGTVLCGCARTVMSVGGNLSACALGWSAGMCKKSLFGRILWLWPLIWRESSSAWTGAAPCWIERDPIFLPDGWRIRGELGILESRSGESTYSGEFLSEPGRANGEIENVTGLCPFSCGRRSCRVVAWCSGCVSSDGELDTNALVLRGDLCRTSYLLCRPAATSPRVSLECGCGGGGKKPLRKPGEFVDLQCGDCSGGSIPDGSSEDSNGRELRRCGRIGQDGNAECNTASGYSATTSTLGGGLVWSGRERGGGRPFLHHQRTFFRTCLRFRCGDGEPGRTSRGSVKSLCDGKVVGSPLHNSNHCPGEHLRYKVQQDCRGKTELSSLVFVCPDPVWRDEDWRLASAGTSVSSKRGAQPARGYRWRCVYAHGFRCCRAVCRRASSGTYVSWRGRGTRGACSPQADSSESNAQGSRLSANRPEAPSSKRAIAGSLGCRKGSDGAAGDSSWKAFGGSQWCLALFTAECDTERDALDNSCPQVWHSLKGGWRAALAFPCGGPAVARLPGKACCRIADSTTSCHQPGQFLYTCSSFTPECTFSIDTGAPIGNRTRDRKRCRELCSGIPAGSSGGPSRAALGDATRVITGARQAIQQARMDLGFPPAIEMDPDVEISPTCLAELIP